jgi:hypothetical protein
MIELFLMSSLLVNQPQWSQLNTQYKTVQNPFYISQYIRPNQGEVKIANSNWKILPNYYGDQGAIEYTVVVENLSSKYIEDVKIEITSYDNKGNVITSDYTFVTTIPPGQKRSRTKNLDFYGSEKKLSFQILDLTFAGSKK